ncbi:probable pectinesterase/pectinesterase inhibitor 51 isoform X1 [Euphorbia lathyris]|uniref:probable pectinesterase/pectinesterase inhibitor 51 isoform X1 n=1 Tax=Euphorbia lathyris TaxID=212925 RepID=UPI00331336EC
MTTPSSPSGSTKPIHLVQPKPRLKFRSLIFVVIGLFCLLCLVASIILLTPHRKYSHSAPPKSPSNTTTPQPETPEPPPKKIVPVAEIKLACKATQYPQICESSLIESNIAPSNPIPVQIIQSALSLSYNNLTSAQSMLESILVSEAGNENITRLAKTCLEIIGYSQYRMSKVNGTLPKGDTKNARAWMSAAVAYQYDCYGGLSYHGGNTTEINQTRSYLNTSVTLGSNTLSMIISYDLYGNETSSWEPPKTERDGFWEGPGLSSEMGFSGGFPSKLKADATVCKDGSGGCYKTVQEAVNAAPNNTMDSKFVIHIKEGVYDEIVRILFEKKNVVFLGDGIGKSVITGSLSAAQPGVTTFESATVGVLGDGFMASGLTIQNTAGAPTHQAVAFRSDSDLSLVENCEFIGNQDTLYAHSLRQYYKSCRIQGNVDFIFGNSAAIFDDCEILVSPRLEKPEHGENNAVTAHGRTDPAQSTGFVFQNCLINGTEKYMELYHSNPSVHKNYLGRPWKQYSRVVFINCEFEALIAAEGWMPWSGDFALNTLYYGEFENKGPGSNLSQRVAWSSKIPKDHVHTYSVQNFIQGDEWIPTSS